MRNSLIILNILLMSALGLPAHAALNIFACEPEWAALAQELTGDKASIYAATNALQDPHHVEARPSLIAKARSAQLLVCTGAELEAGWLPVILREAANPDIAEGKPGNFEAAHYVTMLEVPARLDRGEGDVHAAGNPHIHLDARNFLPVADALSARISELDPANAAFYAQRLHDFRQKWQAALLRWSALATPLKGQPVVVQHRSYPYLHAWLGLQQVAELEPKPGMEPGAAYLSGLVAQLKARPARMVIRSAYQDGRPSQWIAQRTGLHTVELPFSVGGNAQAGDLFSLFDDTIARLLAGLK
ncbi:MAG: zinc ABC transporter substrate-binding protein [Gallionellaceae bacterium]|jgi:zinc/manganese transport system substrate-binding protein